MNAAELIALLQQLPADTPLDLIWDDRNDLPALRAHTKARAYMLGLDGSDEGWA